MSVTTRADAAIPLWFVAAFVPMIGSQLLRLHQIDPGWWLFWDYAGRIGAIAILIAIPAARAIAFQQGRLTMPLWAVAVGIVGLIVFERTDGIGIFLDRALPHTVIAHYVPIRGWLQVVDESLGILLVAIHEELIFRRAALSVLRPFLRNDLALVAASTLLFGAYHWWSGIGNATDAAEFGALAMIFYLRAGVLWPLVLAHYVIDALYFGGVDLWRLTMMASLVFFSLFAFWLFRGFGRVREPA